MAPHGVYRCEGEDQWVTIACRHDEDWHNLCAVIDGLDRDSDLTARRQRHDKIDRQIELWTCRHDKHEAAARLQQAGVPAGAVNATPDMVADAQVEARKFFVPCETVGDVATPMPGNPIKMPGLDSGEWRPCPRLGADNREVLQDWLNYSDAEIDLLIDRAVLLDKPPA
jgi:crotonobetainyl-CoA:carnitine CoA-transferase CaiB-like acyl-CoA transferase